VAGAALDATSGADPAPTFTTRLLPAVWMSGSTSRSKPITTRAMALASLP
jgi:hypothetical protein